MVSHLLLLDNNCLNRLRSPTLRRRLRANMRAAGWEFWPTGTNALEAVKSRDRSKRLEFLEVLADLAEDRLALPMPQDALQRAALAIANRDQNIDWADHRLTRLFRYPDSVTDDEVQVVRDCLISAEADFDRLHQKAAAAIRPFLRSHRGFRPQLPEYLDEVWSSEQHLAPYIQGLWQHWALPGLPQVAAVLRQQSWRLFFDGWGAAAYARSMAHPQKGKVQSSDLLQLVYFGAAPRRLLVTEDREFRDLGNIVVRSRYHLAQLVDLDTMIR